MIVGMTMTLLASLAACTVGTKCVTGNFACTKRLFKFSIKLNIQVLNAHPDVRYAICPFENQISLFLLTCNCGVYIFGETQKNHIMIILELSFILTGSVQDKNVSTSMHGKRIVKNVNNVCVAKRAATISNFLFRTKNQYLHCSEVMGYIAWQ